MRNHYIPKKYQSRFAAEDDPQKIWQYDEKSGKFQLLPFESVGVLKGWFSPETEKEASIVEAKANAPIDKLALSHQELDEEEKEAVCKYIAFMMQRTPPWRQVAQFITGKEYDSIRQGNYPPPVENEFQRFDADGTRENIIDDTAKLLHPLPSVKAQLLGMKWTVFWVQGVRHFITSDVPVFWDQVKGIGALDTDLSMPLGSNAVLYISTGYSDGRTSFVEADEKAWKALNRRAVYNSERFIFASKRENWIRQISRNKRSNPYGRVRGTGNRQPPAGLAARGTPLHPLAGSAGKPGQAL